MPCLANLPGTNLPRTLPITTEPQERQQRTGLEISFMSWPFSTRSWVSSQMGILRIRLMEVRVSQDISLAIIVLDGIARGRALALGIRSCTILYRE